MVAATGSSDSTP
jgi:hypothetical protein